MAKVDLVTTKERRVRRVRGRIKESPRGRKLVVSRSNKYLFGQIVDLTTGRSILGLTDKSLAKKLAAKKKTERAFELGKKLGEKAVKMGIKRVAFDRGPYRYHGRVKAFAEGARKGGLRF